jgi:hypothetical protein
MSIGFHVRVATYIGDPTIAEKELSEINQVLRQAGLSPYQEPETDPPGIYTIFGRFRCLGRAALDHNSASSFDELGQAAEQHLGADAKMLPLLLLGQPLYFLPISFTDPLYMDNGYHTRQPLCSSQQTTSELVTLAKHLDIPLEGSLLSDATAQTINKAPDEPQVVWLTVFEAARQSVAHNCALVLA